jgi:hypothetical protein
MRKIFSALLIVVFLALTGVYYYNLLGNSELDKTFLTLSTFLFALFAGFFISRQGSRYGDIRKLTADFDGVLSAIYREFGHFGADAQAKAGIIIKDHYEKILQNGWDYPFMNKTTTITDLHNLVEQTVKEKGADGIKNTTATRSLTGLDDLQKIRKNMVALREERIPGFQWLLIYMLTAILLVAVSVMPSGSILIASAIKGAFVVCILVVVTLLRKLDSLQLFAGVIGEHSAQDVVDIIEGKK